MAEEPDSAEPVPRARGAAIMLQDLPLGTQLRLKSGAEVEIVENPRDGQWIFVRPVDAAPDQDPDLVFAADVAELVESDATRGGDA